MSNQQTVQTKGIFHGLPVFPPAVNGLTAIITGANGISGNYMLRVLVESPKRWTKIYCLSRRPPAIPDGLPAQAEHIALDFLQDPENIARVLKEKGVKADYVFFYSYVQAKPKEGGGLWSDAEEMCRVNSRCFFKNQHPLLPQARSSGLTSASCTASELLHGPSSCLYHTETYHVANRCEELRRAPRSHCSTPRRDSSSRDA